MKYIQTELNLGVASIPDVTMEWRSPQYDPAWDELSTETQSTCKSVGGQVETDTKNLAPQHEIQKNHWLEKYWVERGLTKYWYWRYVYREAGRKRKVYLGSVVSPKVKAKKAIVQEQIEIGKLRPSEIIRLIKS